MRSVRGTIAGSFEPKQPKMAIHKKKRQRTTLSAFSSSNQNPSQDNTLNNVTEENCSWNPSSSQKWPTKTKLSVNETEHLTVEMMTRETTEAVLGWPRYHNLQETLS